MNPFRHFSVSGNFRVQGARALSLVLLAVTAAGSMGCVGGAEISLNKVAMCATVTDGSQPVSGPATIHATVLRRDTAIVWEYSGEGVLDSQGRMCLNLANAISPGFYYVDDITGNLDVETLTVTVAGRTVSGILTFVDIYDVSWYPYAEAEFDFADPSPGEPGALAFLNSLNRSRNRLDRSRRIENEAIAIGPARSQETRAGERRHESASEAAI